MPTLASRRRAANKPLTPVLSGLELGDWNHPTPSQEVELRFARTVDLWLAFRQHGLVVTMERLRELRAHDDEEDRPTMAAAMEASNLLIEAYSAMANYFPRGWVTVSPDRGIRIEWRKADLHVRVVIPGNPGGQGYVYYEERETFASEALSAQTLAVRLDSLLHER